MGGSLNLTSEFGVGSCFYFDIPLLVSEDSSVDTYLEPTEEQPSDLLATVAKNPAIIVADDVAVNRHVLLSMLEDVSDDIREAANGLEVIELLRERSAQLVLMDLRMPEMDGMEATRIIKQELNMSDVAIVMASATTDEDMMAEAIEVGCDGFLPKPIGIADLLKIVAKTCGGETKADSPEEVVDTRVSQPSSSVVVPPGRDLQELLMAVDLGDVTGTRELLGQLRRGKPECSSFVAEAEEFLNEFDFDSLARLLRQACDEASLNDA
jgi:CheY-like chemotaxis protein